MVTGYGIGLASHLVGRPELWRRALASRHRYRPVVVGFKRNVVVDSPNKKPRMDKNERE